MEMIVLLVLIFFVLAPLGMVVWVASLSGRQGQLDDRLAALDLRGLALERDVDRLRADAGASKVAIERLEGELAAAKAEMVALGASGGVPAVAPAPAEVGPARIAPRPPAPARAAAVRRAPPAAPAPVGALTTDGRPGVETLVESPPWPRATTVEAAPALSTAAAASTEPAGPGLADRTLVALGLVSESGEPLLSRSSLEAWLEGRMLAVVGGIALLLGAVFFLSLAFSRGWITEEMRIGIGLVAGAGLLFLGEVAFDRLRGTVGPVLVAVGLAIVSLTLFAATRLYGLVPVEWALAGALLAAIAAAVVAVRHDSQIVAAFGLVAVLAAPPILGATPTLVTLLFVATALVGTTAISLVRTWTWLPPLAFVLAAPQIASYVLGSPPAAEALAVVVGFWLLNVVAAGGEETRRPTDRLRPATVTLLLADAAYTLWAGFEVLDGTLTVWRGAFLAVMAVLYLALSLLFFVRNGDRHPFGLLVAATGIAGLTMAVPIQAGGAPVPIAWAAEAVALAWIAVLRRHPYSAAVSILLGVLALGYLVAVEYPPQELSRGYARSVPFVGPEGLTFAFATGALVVAGLIVPITWVRAGLAVVGALLALYVVPFELDGPAEVAVWSAIAAAGTVLFVRVLAARVPVGLREGRTELLRVPAPASGVVAESVAALSGLVRPAFAATAVLAWALAVGHLALVDYPFWKLVEGTPHPVPFVALPGLSFAIVLAALGITGILTPVAWIRVALAALGGFVALYVFPFELSGPDLMWAWGALTVAAFAVEVRLVEPRVGPSFVDPPFIDRWRAWFVRPCVRAIGALAWLAMLGHLLVLDFPPSELGRTLISSPPFIGPEGASFGAIMAALALSAWILRQRWIRLGAVGIGVALFAYTVTFEIDQPAVAVVWAALSLAALLVVRRVVRIGPLPPTDAWTLELVAERLPFAAAALALGFLAARSIVLADPAALIAYLTGSLPLDAAPFADERTFVLVVLAATVAVAGWTWGGIVAPLWSGVAAALVFAWLLPFEVRAAYAVAGWSAIALGALVVLRWMPTVPTAREVLGGTAIGLLMVGGAVALVIVAPPDRLIVDPTTVVLQVGILTDATVALGSLTIALAGGALLHPGEWLAMPALVAAGVTFVYLASVAVVDAFQVQVGTRALEDLQKEAQVALSVLWSILGGIFFAAGLVTRRTPVRLFGLALLGLATAKVFLVDLAALDVAYRVASLVALGVLLLICAVAYQRMQHPQGPVTRGHA